jgi:hypothetical protein
MDNPTDPDSPEIFAEDFLHFVLDGNVKFAMKAYAPTGLLDAANAGTSAGIIEESLRAFTGGIMTFAGKEIRLSDSVVDGTRAVVRFSISWDALMADSLARRTFSGIATVRLLKNPFSGWDVVQAIVPGWNA